MRDFEKEILAVSGTPPLTGKLDFAGRRRAEELTVQLDMDTLAFALVERESQVAMLAGKLRDRTT